jgi:NADPH:quinone reductase-like Zn-dependent oxidoreductase
VAKRAAAEAHGAHATLAVAPDVARDEPALRARLDEFVRAHTGGRGADVVVDLAGGPYVNASLHAMAERGRLVLVGLVAGRSAAVDLGRVLGGRLSLRGTVMRARPLEERIATARRFAAEVVPWLADGTVRPTVDRVLPLADAAAAHAALESDDTTGKIVLTVA